MGFHNGALNQSLVAYKSGHKESFNCSKDKIMAKKFKIVNNGNFDLLTACHYIKFDELYSTSIFCNPALYVQSTAFVLPCRMLLSNLVLYLLLVM